MSKLSCHCGVLSDVPIPFVTGAISSVKCPSCGESSAVRSPQPMEEHDMVRELGGDASPIAIEGVPPADAIALPKHATLCLLYTSDAADE